jgi:hypothetical protein
LPNASHADVFADIKARIDAARVQAVRAALGGDAGRFRDWRVELS